MALPVTHAGRVEHEVLQRHGERCGAREEAELAEGPAMALERASTGRR